MAIQDGELRKGPDYHYLSRPERYSEGVRKASHFIRLVRDKTLDGRIDTYYFGNLVFPNETSPLAVHSTMFIPTLESQTTPEQKEKWLQKAVNCEIIGTFAQTELGHGTNLKQLETTAVYDPKTEEFILHSPTVTSCKWWPGGLGKTANHAIVVAMLYSLGQNHGAHSFIVQLRDMNTHEPMPGITLGDIGPKFGFDSIDNGFARFSHVRIPRENMLMKYAQVHRGGTYMRNTYVEKLNYGTMVFIRAMIVWDQAARGLAQAVTIAVRYSCVRRQSELKPGEGEPQVLDYQTQQYKLFPLLAAAYAFWFSGLKMRETYFRLNYEIQQGNTELLPEVHATSSGLKALSTDVASSGIETCRLSCGGHGYSLSSGIPKIYTNMTAACTYEGVNTILYLQTARYLVKTYQQSRQREVVIPKGSTSYLFESLADKCPLTDSMLVDDLIATFKHRAYRLIEKACQRLTRLELEGRESYDAWNQTSVDLVKAAKGHCEVYVLISFREFISSANDDLAAVLTQLLQLHALYSISCQAADFIEDGYVSSIQLGRVHNKLLQLLSIIRPNAVALVDAFDFPDELLCSVLGRFDGQVYENLYRWAANSPLNKTPVHESHKYFKQLLSSSSKL